MKKNNEYHLMTNIINLSNASVWDDAKNEWEFTTAFYRDDSTCLCTKTGIMKVCVITNKNNGLTTEVGRCCVKKFMSVQKADTIFTSLLKLRKNIKSNITKDFFHQLEDDGFFKDVDESRLYSKFLWSPEERKSSDEWNEKVQINKRVLEKFSLSVI